MQEKLVDEQGNTVLAYSTSHPMLRLTRPNTTAVTIDDKEFSAYIEKQKKATKEYTPRNLEAELDSLKAELKKLTDKSSNQPS